MLDKAEMRENHMNMGQMGLRPVFEDEVGLNVVDFELLQCVSVHPKLTEDVALSILKIVCEVAWKHIIYTRASLHVML